LNHVSDSRDYAYTLLMFCSILAFFLHSDRPFVQPSIHSSTRSSFVPFPSTCVSCNTLFLFFTNRFRFTDGIRRRRTIITAHYRPSNASLTLATPPTPTSPSPHALFQAHSNDESIENNAAFLKKPIDLPHLWLNMYS
jgi:hypothetical protein